jgi:hypothetical protein
MTKSGNGKLFYKLALAAFVLAASAVRGHAQNSYQGKFTLATDTHWGNVTLPAGDYTFVLPSSSAPYRLYVQGKGIGAIVTATTAMEKVGSGHAQLTMLSTADGYAIQTFEAPYLGLTFVFPAAAEQRIDRIQTGQKTVSPAMLKSQLTGGKTSIEVQTMTR